MLLILCVLEKLSFPYYTHLYFSILLLYLNSFHVVPSSFSCGFSKLSSILYYGELEDLPILCTFMPMSRVGTWPSGQYRLFLQLLNTPLYNVSQITYINWSLLDFILSIGRDEGGNMNSSGFPINGFILWYSFTLSGAHCTYVPSYNFLGMIYQYSANKVQCKKYI